MHFNPLRTPITILTVWTLCLFYAGPPLTAWWSDLELWEVRRVWGSVETLTWVREVNGWTHLATPDLIGPFDVWDGDWWRVPVSAFHHADGLHLLINTLAVAGFGGALERRWGSGRMLVLSLGAILTCMLPEYLFDRVALGYSGVACAFIGATWAARSWDDVLAEWFPLEALIATLAVLGGMVVLTAMGLLQIANGAHAAGLAYGYAAASFCVAPAARRSWSRLGFYLAHVGLCWPYAAIVTPDWNGRYHWYRADVAPGGLRRAVADDAELERAVTLAPELSGAWRQWADNAALGGDPLTAWDRLIQGLMANPSDAEQWRACRKFWFHYGVLPQRSAFERIVHERYGADAPLVLKTLRSTTEPPVLIGPGLPPQPTGKYGTPVAEVVDEPEWTPPPDRVWPPRTFPQGMPTEWAVEGRTL